MHSASFLIILHEIFAPKQGYVRTRNAHASSTW